jgi:Ran GTPase-activating protein (RanGAP) involved in mRNA processing and transport
MYNNYNYIGVIGVKWSSTADLTLQSSSPSVCGSIVKQIKDGEVACRSIKLIALSSKAALVILQSLHLMPDVTRLEIEYTRVTKEAVDCITKYMTNNKIFKVLSFCDVFFTDCDDGIPSLSRCISSSTTLEEFKISQDTLSEDDVRCISQMISANTSLHVLYLDKCGITNNGLKHLADALAKNSTLKELSISYNDQITLTDTVCEMIRSSSLSVLRVNDISLPNDENLIKIIDALSNNTSITLLGCKKDLKIFQQYKNYHRVKNRINI